MFEISYAGVTLRADPASFQYEFSSGGVTRRFINTPLLYVKNGGPAVSFATAACTAESFKTGATAGVRARYTGFAFPESENGRFDDLAVVHEFEILSDGWLRVSVRTENEPERGLYAIQLQPIAFGEKAGKGYTVLPRMQGQLLPAEDPNTFGGGEYCAYIYERDGYMPLLGQVMNTKSEFGKGEGYTCIIDTPYDSRYVFYHPQGGDTLLTPRFISSLGCIRYKRVLLYHLDTDCDFVTIAKNYRKYLDVRGRAITLREKIAKNPNNAYLIGTPIVHTGIATMISPDSEFYDKEHPEANNWNTTFDFRGEQLRKLKESGVERVYLHLDGWGRKGYDQLHPDVFPPCQEAGGAEGMARLAKTCEELGYVFGIHDQYRDYYYDADTFDIENAVQYGDGSRFYCSVWNGGKQTILCSALALDYVKRNYDEFVRLGIDVRGSYLDVFAIVELDECFHPAHRTSREDCARNRRDCFDFLTSRGIIPSSEEPMDCIVPSIALVHHAPYYTPDVFAMKPLEAGYPLPLFNLVMHDCIVIPWFSLQGGFGIPADYDPEGLQYMNGGTVYWPEAGADEEETARLKASLAFHERIALGEMVDHELSLIHI